MSVVLNTTIPSSALKKKHLSCSYHHIRESIASGIIKYGHVASNENIADLFAKPSGPTALFCLLAMYLFRKPKSLLEIKNKSVKEE